MHKKQTILNTDFSDVKLSKSAGRRPDPVVDIHIDLKKLQARQKTWQEYNFGPAPGSSRCILGAMEELGELTHAHLKANQKIRTAENHEANKQDAVGDIVIYLVGYCNDNGFNFDECISKTWSNVKKRDWKKNPRTAADQVKGD